MNVSCRNNDEITGIESVYYGCTLWRIVSTRQSFKTMVIFFPVRLTRRGRDIQRERERGSGSDREKERERRCLVCQPSSPPPLYLRPARCKLTFSGGGGVGGCGRVVRVCAGVRVCEVQTQKTGRVRGVRLLPRPSRRRRRPTVPGRKAV